MQEPREKYLTPKQAAKYIKMDYEDFLDIIKAEKEKPTEDGLKVSHIGTRKRIDIDEIDRWMTTLIPRPKTA